MTIKRYKHIGVWVNRDGRWCPASEALCPENVEGEWVRHEDYLKEINKFKEDIPTKWQLMDASERMEMIMICPTVAEWIRRISEGME